MKKYIVNLSWTVTQQVELEAESEQDACNKAFVKIGPPSNADIKYDVEKDY